MSLNLQHDIYEKDGVFHLETREGGAQGRLVFSDTFAYLDQERLDLLATGILQALHRVNEQGDPDPVEQTRLHLKIADVFGALPKKRKVEMTSYARHLLVEAKLSEDTVLYELKRLNEKLKAGMPEAELKRCIADAQSTPQGHESTSAERRELMNRPPLKKGWR